MPGLSAREIEVLRLVARGSSNAEIARELTISHGTVKSHLRRIFVKMGVSDRTQAAVSALRLGAIRL
jgi:DNA-binding NarL/FixJ family response regulator